MFLGPIKGLAATTPIGLKQNQKVEEQKQNTGHWPLRVIPVNRGQPLSISDPSRA